MNISSTSWLCIFAVIFFSHFSESLASEEKRPNIVVVMADDIGSGDISYFTKRFLDKEPIFETPNIDSLAEKGIWFSDGHSATALCAPTRYAIMSGKNNYRSYSPWGVWDIFQKNAISNSEPTIGKVAKEAGYRTGFVGKWHLGGDFKLKDSDEIFRGNSKQNLPQVDLNKMISGGPKDMGFVYSFMLPDGVQGPIYTAYENEEWYPLAKNSQIQYINAKNVYDKRMISSKGAGMGDTQWRTEDIGDLISQKAADFISREKSPTPFMLYYASPMPHVPHMPPATFDGVKVAGTTGSAHMDMIKELDLQVGRIISALKESGQYENTVFFFTSDNGGLARRETISTGHLSNGKYRGSKNLPHEGGHRVPFIVHWPNKIKTSRINAEIVIVQDLLATIGDIVGNPQNQSQAPDSNNLLPLLVGTSEFTSREYLMMQSGASLEVMFREGDWKLIMQSNRKATEFKPIALFNLQDNLLEKESLNFVNRATHKQKVERMLARYKEIRLSGQATAW